MKKLHIVRWLFPAVIAILACNLSTQPTRMPVVVVDATPHVETAVFTNTAPAGEAPTNTSTAVRGATPGPTPTLVPPAFCPPYAFDSIGADFASITDPALFSGKHYNPAEYNAVFGGFAGEMLDDVHALEELSKDGRSVEFLERLVCRNSGGKAYFEVKDALLLALAAGQSIARLCWAGEAPIHPVLAIGHVDPNQPQVTYQNMTGWRYDRLDAVYRVDLERETFTPVPAGGVVCLEIMEGGD